MSLPVPRYVQVDGLTRATIRYRWDDWDVEAVDMPVDEALKQRLKGMSQRAVAAFSIAACEWVVHRFSGLAGDALPRQYLEAAWAQVCDFRYATHFDIDVDQWRGPVRGPLGTALRRVKFSLKQAEVEGDPAWSAGRLVRLAEHVLPEKAAFQAWRDCIIDRFIALYPFDPQESLGDPIPWQFADPAFEARPDVAEALLEAFLRQLDPAGNPFLNSFGTMLAQGFVGQPYVLDLAGDRRRRFEW